MPASPSPANEVFETFTLMPRLQLVFIVLAAVTWLIGGNILIAFHYRRIGKPIWSGFVPFAFPWHRFNAQEWLTLFCLLVLSLLFGAIAFTLGP
jgi:hypothetical protein